MLLLGISREGVEACLRRWWWCSLMEVLIMEPPLLLLLLLLLPGASTEGAEAGAAGAEETGLRAAFFGIMFSTVSWIPFSSSLTYLATCPEMPFLPSLPPPPPPWSSSRPMPTIPRPPTAFCPPTPPPTTTAAATSPLPLPPPPPFSRAGQVVFRSSSSFADTTWNDLLLLTAAGCWW